ncbi:hypothetical protein RFI_01518 [Reticulomyxa filosa]|uniref:Uncharacterized protein n=1 Tax=Reticulomyxa filosa TaxID=46433 RepID=X6PBI3_RETFI|nr:hypothetical protein RFI_01518 [Reticulomyxa filosa]|eukprot:ETO35546.1 hypothetical protein RFI_01518 [Reticulomyxa filosa]
MTSKEVFVTIRSKKYRITLTCLQVEALKQKIIEVTKGDEENELVKITDSNNCDIATDERLEQMIEFNELDIYAYFGKKEEQKIKHPLVLLTGSIQYEKQFRLEDVKQDLYLLKELFAMRFGYQVFSIFDSENVSTETITLKDLDQFIDKYNSNDNSINMNDGLIFVWCGHGELEKDNNTLVTSDNQIKDFKDIQDKFRTKNGYFARKPKIFVKITYNQNKMEMEHNQEEDMFEIFVSIPQELTISNLENKQKHNYFMKVFCQVIENDINQSLNFIIKQINTILFGRELFQYTWTDIYLIPRLPNANHNNDKNTLETLDFKKHWNKNWRKSNVEASKLVKEMITKNKQGIIIVAKHLTETKSNFSSSFLHLLLNNKNINKEQFTDYWIYVIKSKMITLDGITIDGNVYAVNCEIQCKGDVNITTQLFYTENCIIDEKLKTNSMKFILWDIKIHCDIPILLQDLEDENENFSRSGNFDDAIIYLQKHLQICTNTFGYFHPYVAISYNLIGFLFDDKHQHDIAIHYYEKGLNILLNIFGLYSSFVSSLYENLGITYNKKGIYDKAIQCFHQSLKIRNQIFEIINTDISDSYWGLAISFENKGEMETAYKYYENAWKTYNTVLGEYNAETLRTKYRIYALSEEINKKGSEK